MRVGEAGEMQTRAGEGEDVLLFKLCCGFIASYSDAFTLVESSQKDR
jgi:hypothetical protein